MSGRKRNLNIKEPSHLCCYLPERGWTYVSSGLHSWWVRESYSSKVLCSACGPWQGYALQSALRTNIGKPHHNQKNCHWPEERLTSVDLPEGRRPPWASLKEDDNTKVVKYKKNRTNLCVLGLPRIICALSRPWEPKPELREFWFFCDIVRTIIMRNIIIWRQTPSGF